MFKINLEDYKVDRYRLFHSRKFQGMKFVKARNKLSDDSRNPKYLYSIRGLGYKLIQ